VKPGKNTALPKNFAPPQPETNIWCGFGMVKFDWKTMTFAEKKTPPRVEIIELR
jgi:hypothetical protein